MGSPPGTAAMVPTTAVPSGAFFMIPPAAGATMGHGAGPSNQSQLWAIPATMTPVFNVSGRPISNFVSAMQPGPTVNFAGGGSGGEVQGQVGSASNNVGHGEKNMSGKVSTMATSTTSSQTAGAAKSASSAASTGITNTSNTTTQMLRDFSLEIYDKRELQFMVGAGNDQQTPSPKS